MKHDPLTLHMSHPLKSRLASLSAKPSGVMGRAAAIALVCAGTALAAPAPRDAGASARAQGAEVSIKIDLSETEEARLQGLLDAARNDPAQASAVTAFMDTRIATHDAALRASGEHDRILVDCSKRATAASYTVDTQLGPATVDCTPRPATIESRIAALMASPDLDMRAKKAKARGMMAGHMRREWMDANPNPTPQQTFESCLAKIDFLNRNYRYEGHDYDPDATAKTCEKYRPG